MELFGGIDTNSSCEGADLLCWHQGPACSGPSANAELRLPPKKLRLLIPRITYANTVKCSERHRHRPSLGPPQAGLGAAWRAGAPRAAPVSSGSRRRAFPLPPYARRGGGGGGQAEAGHGRPIAACWLARASAAPRAAVAASPPSRPPAAGPPGGWARRGQREAGLACGRRKEAEEEEEEEEEAAAGSRGRGAGGGPGEGRSGICGAPRRCREPAGPRVTGVTAGAGGAAASDPPPGGAQPRPGPAPFPPRAASPPPPPPRERSPAHPAPAAEPGSRVGVGRPARAAPGPRGGHCSRSPGGAAPPPSELGCPDMKVSAVMHV
ncbi:basic proline-rich protein-like [Pan paniscus]|uniref:basic proline-rich protein-like n=1 Tax=Pan paniscus TaxID=9597 RepID=UPI0030072C47